MNVARARLLLFVIGVALAAGTAGWLFLLQTRTPAVSPPAVLGAVGPFRLTSQAGTASGSGELAGKVWVADFVFTRCPGPCPLITDRMARLEKTMPADPRLAFVTFTVDPDHDTPAVLRKYIAERGLRTARWIFLTGPRRTVKDLLVKSFRLPLGDPDFQAAKVLVIPHTEKMVLVDGQGNIRGYYETGDEPELARLQRETAAVLREKPGA